MKLFLQTSWCALALQALVIGMPAQAADQVYQRNAESASIELSNIEEADASVVAVDKTPAPKPVAPIAAMPPAKRASAVVAAPLTAAAPAADVGPPTVTAISAVVPTSPSTSTAAEDLQTSLQQYREMKIQSAANQAENNNNPATGRRYLKVDKSMFSSQ